MCAWTSWEVLESNEHLLRPTLPCPLRRADEILDHHLASRNLFRGFGNSRLIRKIALFRFLTLERLQISGCPSILLT